MSILNLFKNTQAEKPSGTFNHSILGELRLSEKKDCWLGKFSTIQFSIKYEGKSEPPENLLFLAQKLAEKPSELLSLHTQIKKAAASIIVNDQTPLTELDSLVISKISLYNHRRNSKKPRMNIELKSDNRELEWYAVTNEFDLMRVSLKNSYA